MKENLQTQSAMVRILLYLEGDSPTKRNLFPRVNVEKVEMFPLAFSHCEDFLIQSYQQISKEIKHGSQKLNDYLIISESGYYEMVGKYDADVLTDEQGQYSGALWELSDIKVYQLTEEETELLKQNQSV